MESHLDQQSSANQQPIMMRVLKDKSGISRINDKVQGYNVINGVCYFLQHLLSLLCEIAYSNKQPRG